MARRDWVLDIRKDAGGSDPYSIWLGLKGPGAGNVVEVISCRSVEELQREVSHLMGELDGLIESARSQMAGLQPGAGAARLVPEDVWRKIESTGSEKEMFEYFNSFAEPDRKTIAEYVFSRVNMFKGKGPIFSEHYDSDSHLLE